MAADTTRHSATTDLDLRPGSAELVSDEDDMQWTDDAPQLLSGNVIPAHSPFAHGIHPAYQGLPLHVAALIDHHELPRPDPEIIALIRRWHLWPAIGSCSFSALGWWANLEPNHVWLMLPFLGLGVLGPVAGWLGHLAHGDEADQHLTRGLIVGGAIGMSGAAAVGAGFSGFSAMTTALLAAVGTLGSIQWRHHRRQADRNFIIDYTAAVATAPMPPAPIGGTAAPMELTQHGIMSDEAQRLHQAFAAMGVSPITVDVIRRSGPDSWMTFVYLPESKSMSPKSSGLNSLAF